jgi:hypothetical protein
VAAGGGASGSDGVLGRAYILSQRMLHFLQNFMYYMMCEVVEPNWRGLMDSACHIIKFIIRD